MNLAVDFSVFLFSPFSFLAFVFRIFAVLCCFVSLDGLLVYFPLALFHRLFPPLPPFALSLLATARYSDDKRAGRKVTLAKLPG